MDDGCVLGSGSPLPWELKFRGECLFSIFYPVGNNPTQLQENTFQAVLITDGVDSFTVFTYNCGLIEWDNGGSNIVGFNAAGQAYDNEEPSGIDLACINGNASNWSNVVYTLSMMTEIPMEPGKPLHHTHWVNVDSPLLIISSAIHTGFYQY